MNPRFSVQQKYRICQLFFGLGFAAAVYCIAHLSPFASAHHNKVWFGALMASVLFTLPFGIAFYYYRSKLHDVDAGLVQVETLARAGQKPKALDSETKDKL